MFNLLRSDLYRTLRLPMFWIYIAIVAVMCLMVAGTVSFLASEEFAQMVNDSIEQTQASDLSEAEKAGEIAEYQEDLDEVEPLNEKELPSLSYAWANFFFGSGFLGILGSCFIGIYLARDMRSFVKNLPLDKRSRRIYFAEKLIYVALIQAFFLVLCLGVGTLGLSFAGITFETEESVGFLAMWAVLVWLILTAYAFLISCISWITRSEWISAFGSVFISSGIMGTTIIFFSELLAPAFSVLNALPYWTLAGASGALDAPESQFFQQAAAYPIPAIGPEGQIVLLAGIVILVAIVFAMTVCRRRNIK